MSQPLIGEIIMFAGTFAPRGWAYCDGQLLPINQNQALFSIFGTIYGGDGRTTFALPDLRGRTPIHQGSGPGLPTYRQGIKGGQEQVFLNSTNLPPHAHEIPVSSAIADQTDPAGAILAQTPEVAYTDAANNPGSNYPSDSSITGNNQALNNMGPSIAINYIVALVGIFPSRN